MKQESKASAQNNNNGDLFTFRSDVRGGTDLLTQLEQQEQENPTDPIEIITGFLHTPGS